MITKHGELKNSWSRGLLDELTFGHLLKENPPFMIIENSLPCSK
jgi:hypothetical protein